MNRKSSRLLRTFVKICGIEDQRVIHSLSNQSPFTVVKKNPYKFMKQVYKTLSSQERVVFKSELISRINDSITKKLNKKLDEIVTPSLES